MTYICGKWLKYVVKSLKYLTNGLNMWELTKRFREMAKIFVKWLRYIWHGLSIRGTAFVCCKLLQYLKYGFDAWQKA